MVVDISAAAAATRKRFFIFGLVAMGGPRRRKLARKVVWRDWICEPFTYYSRKVANSRRRLCVLGPPVQLLRAGVFNKEIAGGDVGCGPGIYTPDVKTVVDDADQGLKLLPIYAAVATIHIGVLTSLLG